MNIEEITDIENKLLEARKHLNIGLESVDSVSGRSILNNIGMILTVAEVLLSEVKRLNEAWKKESDDLRAEVKRLQAIIDGYENYAKAQKRG